MEHTKKIGFTREEDKRTKKRGFTIEEDEQLKNLIEIYTRDGKEISWVNISKNIPGKNPKQCRERWTNNLNPNIKRKEWTEEEDNIIKIEVNKIGNKWTQISEFLPGRTPNSIKNRYNSVLKKRFTPEERRILNHTMNSFAIRKERVDWKKVAKNIPNRSEQECRKGWNDNFLNPNIQFNADWTTNEEKLLSGLYEVYGPDFKSISTFFPDTRTPNSLKNHMGYLLNIGNPYKYCGDIVKVPNLKKTSKTSNNGNNNSEKMLNNAIADINQLFPTLNQDNNINKTGL